MTAAAKGADVIVTIGGASVGDHDLVAQVAGALGLERAFWKIAMRPGKPLMFGTLEGRLFLGLPGNPVSSMVCALLFLQPAVRALLADRRASSLPTLAAELAAPLPANDAREDYLRARLTPRAGALPLVEAAPAQDSSMLGVLARADVLIVRPPRAAAVPAGAIVEVLSLDGSM